jgi:hypothetical protein
VRLELAANGSRLTAHLGGVIAEKDHPIGFTRRADDPRLLAGYAMKALLHGAGMAVEGGVQLGGESAKSLLVLHRSRPLSQILYELGKDSDNFYAEMVLKTLGAEQKGRPGKSADGAEVVVKYLREIGAFEEGMIIKNGSGLFDANRVTAWGTVKLLRAAYRDPAISSEFVGQLAIGGVDGTLHKRFRELRDKRIFAAAPRSDRPLPATVMGSICKRRLLSQSPPTTWSAGCPARVAMTNSSTPSLTRVAQAARASRATRRAAQLTSRRGDVPRRHSPITADRSFY